MSDLPPPLKPAITVQDSVHGRVWLTHLEVDLINTAEFQRLRGIAQLGLANFVFPTATHSRFAHSLGATHVMGWMLRQGALQEYVEDREQFVQLMRLAALLHDLGHYPFSHLGENVYSGIERGALDEPPDGWTMFDVAARLTRDARADHERMTAEIIRKTRIAEIINEHVGKVDGQDASEVLIQIIDGSYPDSVFHSLISSDLDCDRLDYLTRDSLAAGLNYGRVDLGYLIENLRIGDHPRYGPVLAVDREHGFSAVEHYLHARYFHYAQFITHKAIASAELLLAVAMLELARASLIPATADEVAGMVGTEGFLGFTDARIWTLLTDARSMKVSEELKESASSLVHRTLLKCAIRLDSLEKDDGEIYEHIQLDKLLGEPEAKLATAESAGVDPTAFCYKSNSLKLTGVPARLKPKPDPERYEWIDTVNVVEPGGVPEPVVLCKGLLENLSTQRWTTRRVFVREPRVEASGKDSSSRPTTAKLEEYLRRQLARQ